MRFLFEERYSQVPTMSDTLKANNFDSYIDHLNDWEANQEVAYQD